MRAVILWMVMVCLSDGKITKCSVETIISVSKPSKVFISCPANMADSSEWHYLLYFNDSCISSISLTKVVDRACSGPPLDGNTNKPGSGSADGLLSSHYEVTASNSGVYTCKREMVYPPPYKEDCHSTEVVLAETQNTNETSPLASWSCPEKFPFIPEMVLWVGCGALLVYSLSITCISVVLWMKLKRNEEDANVYINTRPGELKKSWKA
ncbi:hypothetical protein PAMA_002934 [Pampus argenteus]